jgi:hypothetical protein
MDWVRETRCFNNYVSLRVIVMTDIPNLWFLLTFFNLLFDLNRIANGR